MACIVKAGGPGPRPIAFIASLFRVWARMRQALAKEWEREPGPPCFWGSKGRACDRAGWEHEFYNYLSSLE
eukprot:7926499-Pyramimonas_sp.AAC.1